MVGSKAEILIDGIGKSGQAAGMNYIVAETVAQKEAWKLINSQRAELERLRAALNEILEEIPADPKLPLIHKIKEIASKALK